MMTPAINMTIGRYGFNYVHSLEVESSWEMLTDRARIILPSNLKIDKAKLRTMLSPGDEVKIEIGYDGQLTEVFAGFVTSISPATPVEVECEDKMFSLKKSSITEMIKNARLSDIVNRYFSDQMAVYDDCEIGTIQFAKLSKAQILEKLRESHRLYSFYRAGQLTIGKIYDPSAASGFIFKFHYNILDEGLKYQRKEDMKLKVVAVSNQPDGTIRQERVGDSEGEERTLTFYNLSKTALKEAATRELNRLKYDGYHGEFTAFGTPLVFHGDIITLEDTEESDKTGYYYADKVIYSFGIDGFRQTITLGPKV